MLERIRRQRHRKWVLRTTLLRLEQSARGFLVFAELIDDREFVAFPKETAAERRSMADQMRRFRGQHPILEIEPRVDVAGTVHRAWMDHNAGRTTEALGRRGPPRGTASRKRYRPRLRKRRITKLGFEIVDIVTAATMESLVHYDAEPCVSVYMPTHRFGRETAQGPIRLATLLDRARDELVAAGMRTPDVDELLDRGRLRTERDGFWQHQEQGLVMFMAPQRTWMFRLPVTFTELVVVANAFHVKPLWPVVSGDDLFYLLALSRNRVRLLWADRFRVGTVDLPEDVPTSLAEALWFDDPEKQLQHHAAARVGQGRVVATFHGHGVPDEKGEAKLATFLRAVDGALRDLLDPDTPLILAGVEEINAVFRNLSGHPMIVKETIRGNPDELTAHELHEKAADLMRPLLEETRQSDAAGFLAAGDLAVTTVPAAVSAALTGRVAVLFLPVGIQTWGRVESNGLRIDVHDRRVPGDRDLLDLAGAQTWATGGRVHAVAPGDVPGEGTVAAHLRY